jgi:hypothetical protein
MKENWEKEGRDGRELGRKTVQGIKDMKRKVGKKK